jgi:hypothetical protein
MSWWLLTFWLIGADGKVFAHDTLHGFGSEADCREFGSHIPVKHGMVRWTCQKENFEHPAGWYHETGIGN